jgi:sporulation protein YlmC with PRC-barrel domain
MKWTKTWASTISLLSLLLVTVAFAAEPAKVGESSYIYRTSKLIGTNVENPQGENLGEIEEIVIDPQSGQMAYAVLSLGGFLGMGEKYFAIPWEALTPKTPTTKGAQYDRFVLNVDKERLRNAPSFNKDNWPDMADRRWAQQVYSHYGIQPYWEHREARMSGAGTMAATVQNVDQNAKLLRLRTANDEVVELKAPTELLSTLQTGDRVEVVIHKRGDKAQPKAQPPAATQPAR